MTVHGVARGFQPNVLLRVVAIAIAVAAVIDPAITISGAARPRLAVLVQQPSAAAGAVRTRLTRDLGPSFEIVPGITSDAAAAIVVGDHYLEEPVPAALPIGTVTHAPVALPDVRIVRVEAPADVPAGTAIHLGVDVESAGATGVSDVIVSSGGLEAGRASHKWSSATERWHANIDAVPVGEPPFVLHVEVSGLPALPKPGDGNGGSRTVADVIVDVRRAPLRVQVYEPRPSWAVTFVRRALEADPRFQVASLSFSSRGIAARTRDDAPLGDPRLDTFDVVIAGGLERLSAADARSLDRFLRERGGAVVLVPDQRIDAGPARDLIAGRLDFVERLLEQPATLAVAPPAAPFEASELLILRTRMPASEVVASVPGADSSPVIVSMPHGDGRLLVSGAMDAWRFRADNNSAFDRFWQSTIAGLALAAPPPLSVDVEPSLLRPGERGDVTVRMRSSDGAPVSATLDADQPIRLTPAAGAGVFHGTFTAPGSPGRSRVTVEAGGPHPQSASRSIVVRADAHSLRAAAVPALSMLSSSHHGIDVAPDRLADVERFVRGATAAPAVKIVRRPMRSVWWILPFAACLSGEWWLRRRRGLR